MASFLAPASLTCSASSFSSMTKLFHKVTSSVAFPFCLFPQPQPLLFTATISTVTSQDVTPNSNLGFLPKSHPSGPFSWSRHKIVISSHLLQIEFIALTSSSKLSRWLWAYLPTLYPYIQGTAPGLFTSPSSLQPLGPYPSFHYFVYWKFFPLSILTRSTLADFH